MVVVVVAVAVVVVVVVVVGCLTFQKHASVFHGRIRSDNCIYWNSEREAADHPVTLRETLQNTLAISPSLSILTAGRPVQALTLRRPAAGREASGVPISSHG